MSLVTPAQRTGNRKGTGRHPLFTDAANKWIDSIDSSPRTIICYQFAAQAVVYTELDVTLDYIISPPGDHTAGAFQGGVFWRTVEEVSQINGPYVMTSFIPYTIVCGILNTFAAGHLLGHEEQALVDVLTKALSGKTSGAAMIDLYYDFVYTTIEQNRALIAALAETLLQQKRMEGNDVLNFIFQARYS